MTTLALQLAALVYCLVLPGFIFALGSERKSIVVLEAFTFALLVVPMACFCAAWLLETNIRPPLVFGVATIFNVAGLARLLWMRQRSNLGAKT